MGGGYLTSDRYSVSGFRDDAGGGAMVRRSANLEGYDLLLMSMLVMVETMLGNAIRGDPMVNDNHCPAVRILGT